MLINHTFSPTDGQGKVNAQVARHLLAQGASVTLVGRDTPDDIASHPRAKVFPLGPVAAAPTQLLKHITFGWRTKNHLDRHRSEHDLVIANGGMTFAPTDVNLCHFVHASWVKSAEHPLRSASRISGPWGWYQYAYSKQACLWERNAYRRARRIVAVSDLVKRQLIDDVGIEAEKIRVIENGIDQSDLAVERTASREKMGVGDGAFVVLFVGDLKTPRKNFDVLLRALPNLPESVRLIAAGDQQGGPYESMVDRLGLGDRVRFLGMRSDVRDLYPGADVFALLSHYDPFALVVTEAMAAGIPVVTASTVGASSVVLRFEAGVVVPDPTDERAVGKAIEQLILEPKIRQRMGDQGPQAAADLAWDQVGKRYADLFAEVAQEKLEAIG